MLKVFFFEMYYISKINIKRKTARAKHLRSLIQANKNLNLPIQFIFYDFKKPFRNLKSILFILISSFKGRVKVYTRDIELALFFSIFNIDSIYEVHQFGMIRRTTRFYLFHRLILLLLINSKFTKFVLLTKNSSRVIKTLYPNLNNKRIFTISDAGGFANQNLNVKTKNNEKRNRKLIISYAGSFLPGKGGIETIKIAKTINKYQFNIAGFINQKLKNQIVSIDNLKYFNYLSDKEIINFYKKSDILIAPIGKRIFLDQELVNEITFYTSPLKIFEYLSTNKPIITIDRPSTRILKGIPGIWFIEKEKAFCIETWENTINRIKESIDNKNINKIIFQRNRFIYSWESRINDMLKI